MSSFFQYLIFCLKATTHHGVHSPFVYQLTTNCFYTSEWRKKRTFPLTENGFQKMDMLFKQRLTSYFTKEGRTQFKLSFQKELQPPPSVQPDENTVWVFSGIHSQREEWLKFSCQENIRLDFFYWGVLFFKTDQAKELFLLRIF